MECFPGPAMQRRASPHQLQRVQAREARSTRCGSHTHLRVSCCQHRASCGQRTDHRQPLPAHDHRLVTWHQQRIARHHPVSCSLPTLQRHAHSRGGSSCRSPAFASRGRRSDSRTTSPCRVCRPGPTPCAHRGPTMTARSGYRREPQLRDSAARTTRIRTAHRTAHGSTGPHSTAHSAGNSFSQSIPELKNGRQRRASIERLPLAPTVQPPDHAGNARLGESSSALLLRDA